MFWLVGGREGGAAGLFLFSAGRLHPWYSERRAMGVRSGGRLAVGLPG